MAQQQRGGPQRVSVQPQQVTPVRASVQNVQPVNAQPVNVNQGGGGGPSPAIQFFLEGVWQQYVNTRVQFTLLAKQSNGQLTDTKANIEAFLRGPAEYEAAINHEDTGTYIIEFNQPNVEGDYQLHVYADKRELYQWLVQLRNKQSHPGGTIQFFIDGPGLGGGEAGKPVHININVRNTRGEPVDVDIHNFRVMVGANLREEKANVRHVQTGLYRAEFMVAKPGFVPIDVRYAGNSVMNPPLMVTFW